MNWVGYLRFSKPLNCERTCSLVNLIYYLNYIIKFAVQIGSMFTIFLDLSDQNKQPMLHKLANPYY